MRRTTDFKLLLSTFFVGLYIFVGLFSQNFHNHGSGAVFKDFHLQNAEKTVSSASGVAAVDDCLSCHIFHEGKFLVPQEISLIIANIPFAEPPVSLLQTRFLDNNFYSANLRAPPVSFV